MSVNPTTSGSCYTFCMPKMTRDLSDPTLATQGDLNTWGGKLQEDIQEVREELAKKADKADLEKWAKKIMNHMDKHLEAYVENKASNLLGVKHDEIHLVKQKVQDHEERITALER